MGLTPKQKNNQGLLDPRANFNKQYEIENFANLHSQISQINFILTLEGSFKKNKILIEIKKKPYFLIQHKKNSFIFTIPLSYKKGIINKEIPSILSPTNSISNLIFPFLERAPKRSSPTGGALAKIQLWDSLYSQLFLKNTSPVEFYKQLAEKSLRENQIENLSRALPIGDFGASLSRKNQIFYFLRSVFSSFFSRVPKKKTMGQDLSLYRKKIAIQRNDSCSLVNNFYKKELDHSLHRNLYNTKKMIYQRKKMRTFFFLVDFVSSFLFFLKKGKEQPFDDFYRCGERRYYEKERPVGLFYEEFTLHGKKIYQEKKSLNLIKYFFYSANTIQKGINNHNFSKKPTKIFSKNRILSYGFSTGEFQEKFF